MQAREETALIKVLKQSGGLLEKDFVSGEWWALRSTQDANVTVHHCSGSRPLQVIWKTSGDYRKRNGEVSTRDFYRTRSFKKIDSLLKFIREF